MIKRLPFEYKVSLGFCIWAAIWVFNQTRIINELGFSLEDSLKDSLISQVSIAIACYAINRGMISSLPTFRNALFELGRSLALALLCLFVQKWVIPEMILSKEYKVFLDNTLMLRFYANWLFILLMGVLTWSWVFVRDQQESIKRKQDAEKLSREAELASLRQQLQPHFLFNSLNSISALVGSKPDLARTMIQQLSDFLRGTLKKDDKELITLTEELAHLQLYLEIEKVRFGHRLETTIHASEESLLLKLPSLLLQPIVENAIKFGLYDTLEDIEINLSARKENNYLIIEVKNPFDPSTASPKKGTGFGLQSVDRRLFLVYGQPNLLKIKQVENIFITTIKIPQLA